MNDYADDVPPGLAAMLDQWAAENRDELVIDDMHLSFPTPEAAQAVLQLLSDALEAGLINGMSYHRPHPRQTS